MSWILRKFHYSFIILVLVILGVGFLLREQRVERFTRDMGSSTRRRDLKNLSEPEPDDAVHTKENQHRTPSKELVNQGNLDLAQSSNFFYTKKNDSKGNTKNILDLGDVYAIQNKRGEPVQSPITTTIPPTGLSDSVREKIHRDTVKVVRDEIQSIFKDNTYQYKLE